MGANIGTAHGSIFWINLEPCGLFCGSMTWFLLGYGMFATTGFVIVPWLGFSFLGLINIALFNAVSVIAMYSHMKAMTTDPGSVPRLAYPLEDDQQEIDYQHTLMAEGNLGAASSNSNNNSNSGGASSSSNAAGTTGNSRTTQFKKFCRRCKAFKPMRAHHCSICGRCIVKMDHHCPWVNNCVGVGNHKLFLLFVFWVMVACFYSIVLVVSRYASCVLQHQRHCFAHSANLYIMFLMIESVLFGLFTMCMLGDQLSSISTNQTQIDRLKKTKHKYQTEVNEVCGSASYVKFHYTWLIPTPAKFPIGAIMDRIMGFRVLSVDSDGEEMSPLIADGAVSVTAGAVGVGVAGSNHDIRSSNLNGGGSGNNNANNNNNNNLEDDDDDDDDEVGDEEQGSFMQGGPVSTMEDCDFEDSAAGADDRVEHSTASSNRSFYTEEEIDEEDERHQRAVIIIDSKRSSNNLSTTTIPTIPNTNKKNNNNSSSSISSSSNKRNDFNRSISGADLESRLRDSAAAAGGNSVAGSGIASGIYSGGDGGSLPPKSSSVTDATITATAVSPTGREVTVGTSTAVVGPASRRVSAKKHS